MDNEFDNLFTKLAHKNSVFMSYAEIYNGFTVGEGVDVGDGAIGMAIEKNDNHIVIKLDMPKNSIVNIFHHDCREEMKVITGKVKETVLGKEYGSFEKMVIRKSIPHGILVLEDTLAYAILYNPNNEK